MCYKDQSHRNTKDDDRSTQVICKHIRNKRKCTTASCQHHKALQRADLPSHIDDHIRKTNDHRNLCNLRWLER